MVIVFVKVVATAKVAQMVNGIDTLVVAETREIVVIVGITIIQVITMIRDNHNNIAICLSATWGPIHWANESTFCGLRAE